MTDIIDRAQCNEERERESRINAHRGRHQEPQERHQGLIVCLDCHYPIKTARLAALPKAVRCAHCQSRVEAFQKRRR